MKIRYSMVLSLVSTLALVLVTFTACGTRDSGIVSDETSEQPISGVVDESVETGSQYEVPSPVSPYPEVVNLLSQEAFQLIQENRENPDFMIIDVRTEEEYAAGHIEGAVNINVGRLSFSEEIGKLDRDDIYLVYCRTGNRSYGAVTMMQEMGFQTIYHLVYGITEWISTGLPVVQPE